MTSKRREKEPMIPHVRGNVPWQKVGTDTFTINHGDYLVTVDYFSGFWEVDFLHSTHSNTITLKLKTHFARYEIPQVTMHNLNQENVPSFIQIEGSIKPHPFLVILSQMGKQSLQ